ncbi:unnamed protein product [Fraxinus pennsylvanica]|uniref:Retrotransposon Copia-like N-terminal domain-containing protein n=1 Tax=Fraxinus pennsylvanica TaxID=56036 RepID=A0AAD1YXR2_9LAMI|nr:unnamed protein product [Fraxinus pennsylvanica]
MDESDKKMVNEITVTPSSKIIDRKLIGSRNYAQWKRIVHKYVSSVDLGDHLTDDPHPQSDTNPGIRKKWLMEDNKLFNQIQNTLDPTVDDAFEEKRAMFPITSDVKTMREQEEQIVVQCFLVGLGPEYEAARTQLLTSEILPSLSDIYALSFGFARTMTRSRV